MRTTALLFSVLVAAGSQVAFAQTPSVENGRAVFNKWCLPCHAAAPTAAPGMPGGAPPLPGTAALSVKYKDRLPAVLEERTDLAPAFITTVVRGGLFGMPITRKTEVSDAELEAIVAYLTRARR